MPQPEWGVSISKYFVIPQRVIFAVMGFLAMVNAYTMRVCLSLVINQLVARKEEVEKPGEIICPYENATSSNGNASGGEYEWSSELKAFVLSSFYIGYIVTHLPGGMLADKFGGKWTLGLGILSTALFTLITPFSIKWGGSDALIVVRVLTGLGEGTTFPALSVLMSSWIPAKERGMLGSLVFGGGQVGTIVSNVISGYLLDAYDWPIVFYFFGGVGVLWFIIFTLICYNSPDVHPFIKPSEKEYLAKEVGSIQRKQELPPTPWCAILTNLPMIALVFAQIGHDWGFYIMITTLPVYMDNVLHFSIKANGIYSALPYVAMWICSLLFGLIGDIIIRKRIMTITNSRKFMTCLAAFGPAIFLVGASYAGCDRELVVALFTIGMGLMGGFYAGMKLTPLDLSPNFAGILMAITNGIGAITGVVAPTLVGVMTPNGTLLEWRVVFWVAFAVLSVTAVIYAIWASGEVQKFNEPMIGKSEGAGSEIERKIPMLKLDSENFKE